MQIIAAKGVSGYPPLVPDDTQRPSFGENLRKLREAAGYPTQEAFAAKLGLKRPSGISQAEALRGPKVPRAAKIKKLAAALGVEPWQLLEGVVTEIDQLRKPSDLLRQGGVAESSAGGVHEQTADSTIGTEHARSRAIQSRRVTADAEARLRETIDEMRAALDVLAKAALAAGKAEAPEADSVAARKPVRSRRTRKRA